MPHTDRPLEIIAFLDRNGWGDAAMQELSGDFSTRRYARLAKPDGTTAFLMDADDHQKTPQFLAIAEILRQAGITAPEIYAALPERGLALMQDFGDRNVGALLDAGQGAAPYFLQATDIIAQLHQKCDAADLADAKLPFYNAELFTEQAALFLDSYFPLLLDRAATEDERDEFRLLWLSVLRPLDDMPKNLLLRDFMPDNLMQLADGSLGVLDFQDAGLGPIAYDIASLCEEVRRDGGFAQLPAVIARYAGKTGVPSSQDLPRACMIFSAQRHMRILGIVARLGFKAGQREKLAHIPRIKKHLQTLLQEPFLTPVRQWVNDYGLLSRDLL